MGAAQFQKFTKDGSKAKAKVMPSNVFHSQAESSRKNTKNLEDKNRRKSEASRKMVRFFEPSFSENAAVQARDDTFLSRNTCKVCSKIEKKQIAEKDKKTGQENKCSSEK